MFAKYLDIKPEIAEAIKQGKAVVALESTIISHGMPYPQNVETAKKTEQIIRDFGAIPATIAVIDGRMKVGLSDTELECVANSKDVLKLSRRDLPFVVAQKLNGATTVAATMIISAMAGIKIFVTGGIGGVHRDAGESFDVSADLTELGKTNVAVVCAGAKSILDLAATLEYLETLGVPVIGYQTDELPAFYTRQSGFKLIHRAETPEEIAKILKIKWDLNLTGGAVIANPIPEEFAMDYNYISLSIEDALEKAKDLGIRGKDITPYLLSEIKRKTHGESLDANIELVFNNAKLGAQLACALALLK